MEMLFKVVGAIVVFGGAFYYARKYLKNRKSNSPHGKVGGGGSGKLPK